MAQIDIFHCWHCGKSLINIDMTFEAWKEVPFHCDKLCQEKCKTWNFKPKDELEFDKSINGKIVTEDDNNDDYICLHKRNCKAHRETCMKIYGHEKI